MFYVGCTQRLSAVLDNKEDRSSMRILDGAWIDGFQRRFEFHLICELHGLSSWLMIIVNEMNGEAF